VFRDAGGAAAAPQGETQQITGYTTATGLFTSNAFTVPIAVGDDVIIMSGRIAAIPDILATVNHADYGNAKLVRSTTPANTLDVTAGGCAGIDWGNLENEAASVALTNTVISAVGGAVGSVTGAVGSVTGNVGGNVVGSVASVVAAVTTDADSRTASKADVSGLATPAQVNAQMLDVLSVDTLVANQTIVESLRRIGALTSGKVTGAGTGTETFKDYAESASTIVITVDASGNRSAITYNS
jgi:hypothetical protein